jgi:hypothetical protein
MALIANIILLMLSCIVAHTVTAAAGDYGSYTVWGQHSC